ncbi:transcriptional regulator [Flexivirga meconopsidis]|uniref:transcriptional regulator n=1 Tax=Flexivirga meconopsidis TaxID=2977121 RepID=UPI002240C198|nr:transcriptional regulator [Flexivirga meconopsidis]
MDPRAALPSTLHSPVRLAILGSLRTVQQTEFAALQTTFEIPASELSRQLAILEREGLIELAKVRKGRRSVTLVRISDSGRQRFEDYLDALHRIAFAHEPGQT